MNQTLVIALLALVCIGIGWILGAPSSAPTASARDGCAADARSQDAEIDPRPSPTSGSSRERSPTDATELDQGKSSLDPAEIARAYLARIKRIETGPASKRPTREIGLEIAGIRPSRTGLEVLRELYRAVGRSARIQLINAFVISLHTDLLAALALADADEDSYLRDKALAVRLGIAFRSFKDDPAGMAEWNQTYGGLSLSEAWSRNAKGFVDTLSRVAPDEATRILAVFSPFHFRNRRETMAKMGVLKAFEEAGLVAVTKRLLADPAMGEQRLKLLDLLVAASPGDKTARQVLLPLLERSDPESVKLVAFAAWELGRPDRPWAAGPLLDALRRTQSLALAMGLAEAFGKAKGPSAARYLIAALVDDDSAHMRKAIGHALFGSTGVRYQDTHDARWWFNWWQANKGSLGGAALPTR